VAYTSGALSLAALEYLVNLTARDLPRDLVSVAIQIPSRLPVTKILISDLPRNWRVFPATEKLKDIGTNWALEHNTPILVVPSAVIPEEPNYIINPSHKMASRIKVVSIKPFALDVRLLEGRKTSKKHRR
jgi:RES domain-containing protein